MEIIQMLSGPIIGALIGYCTNYIAVKMLFRPLRPVYLFGKKLPFTPGIIPKGQARLAHAVGNALGTTLLTQEDLKKALLSEETKQALRSRFAQLTDEKSEEELGTLAQSVCAEYAHGREVMQEKITDQLVSRVQNMELGKTIAEQVIAAVNEKLSGSFIGQMLGPGMVQGFAEPVQAGIDRYLDMNGYALLYPQVCSFWEETEQKTIGDANALLTQMGAAPADIMVRLYETLLLSHMDGLMKLVDPARLVEEKIAAMQPEALEALVLSVMKKELNALVSLGAVVGFVLGLLNLLFS